MTAIKFMLAVLMGITVLQFLFHRRPIVCISWKQGECTRYSGSCFVCEEWR